MSLLRILLSTSVLLLAMWPHGSLWAEGGDGTRWHWQPALLPKALAVEGMWTDTYRLRESLRDAGIPCEGAYRSIRGVKGLPPSPEDYGAFALIVLSNVDAPAIGQKHLATLRQFVETGGGLVVLGGFWAFDRGGYQGTALGDMLPVTFGEGKAISSAPEGLVLSPASSADWLTGCDFAATPRALFIHELKPKPGATVHLMAGNKPALVSWTYGRGRVVACTLTVNGAPRQDALAFWDWDDWPALLGKTMDWAAGVRPLNTEAMRVPPSASEAAIPDYMEFLTAEKKDSDALRKLCGNMTKGMAQDFFTAWKEDTERFSGDEFETLFAAMIPFASREWAPAIQTFLSGLVVNASHRRSALALLGATGSEEASRALIEALKDEKLASSAARGMGLSGNHGTIESLKRAYGDAMRRSESKEYPGRLDPEAFAGDSADIAAECALALYRLGEKEAVKRLAGTYARLHFYRRVFRNSCKMPKWDDDVMHRWKQGKRLEGNLKRLQREAGPIPEPQLAAFYAFARAVTDPVQAEWVRLAMAQSLSSVKPEAWKPLQEAKDGVVARLASVLSRPRVPQAEER